MRETKRFIIDALTHCHKLRLEWLAIDEDDTVEHIIRWKVRPKSEKKDACQLSAPSSSSSSKGKEKETDQSNGSSNTTDNSPSLPAGAANGNNNNNNNGGGGGNLYPVFPLSGSVVGSDSEDDELGSRSAPAGTVMVETEIMPFYEAWDVKILSKEIALGQL